MNSTAHYRPPVNRSDRFFNTAVRWLADHGVNLAGAQTLTVLGRTSGTPQRTPVNPLTIDGREYLVAPRGNTQWVRNARVAGGGELRRGRRSRTVRLVEVAAEQRVPILRSYLDKWGWEVSRFLPEGLDTDADDTTLAEYADALPVFEVLS
ncbi:nitroreductase/quinone reductase family protein [Gordonia sp. CPCC 205515]|uniref:nitroreductase/quinone reductase family protein n=1 Tax=Gordonia sp. CPCC 205515 TaxID=3140791 RepID=UPI003AF38516